MTADDYEFKFERLEVWKLSLEYLDLCYAIAEKLPRQEEYNLKPQLMRAATSIALNIAEGSTSQSDPEQVRFLKMALRSFVETVACRRLVQRRGYVNAEQGLMVEAEQVGRKLFAKLQAMRRAVTGENKQRSGISRRPSTVNGQPSTVRSS